MSPRTFTDKPLHVTAELPGALLASPLRRAIAFGVDLAILIIPSLAVAVTAALLSLSVSDPQALAGMRALLHQASLDESARDQAFEKVLPLLARIEAPGLPPAARTDIEEGKISEAVDLLRNYDFEFLMNFDEFEKPPLKPSTIRIDVGELIPLSCAVRPGRGVLHALCREQAQRHRWEATARHPGSSSRWSSPVVARKPGALLRIPAYSGHARAFTAGFVARPQSTASS